MRQRFQQFILGTFRRSFVLKIWIKDKETIALITRSQASVIGALLDDDVPVSVAADGACEFSVAWNEALM